MHALRCALAEWQIVRVRILRTRLGLWLLLLGGGFIWLGGDRGSPAAPRELAVRLGALSAVLCVAFGAGADTDRAALRLTLTHPTTPTAVAAGRWLAATGVAATVTLAVLVVEAGRSEAGAGEWARAASAGLGTAGATAGCALVLVWLGGNALAGVLFLYLLLFSGLAPRGLAYLVDAAWLRSAMTAVLTVTPSLWRYRALAAGDAGAWLHALTWMAGGVVVAGRLLRRTAP